MRVRVTEPEFGAVLGEIEIRTHAEDACAGEHCVVHNPSKHHMRDWALLWRTDRGLMERVCPHGIGHPDPDDAKHQEIAGNEGVMIHGCDGCCFDRSVPTSWSGE